MHCSGSVTGCPPASRCSPSRSSRRRWLTEEADAARELHGRTPFATPDPVAIGEPGAGYPMPWAVQTWLPGTPAFDDDPADSAGFAADLAASIAGVRSLDTRGRRFDRPSTGSGRRRRGGDLRRHDAWVQECFRRSVHLVDVPPLRQVWAELRDLPRTGPDRMTHGDLTPGNVLVEGGRLTGVIALSRL